MSHQVRNHRKGPNFTPKFTPLALLNNAKNPPSFLHIFVWFSHITSPCFVKKSINTSETEGVWGAASSVNIYHIFIWSSHVSSVVSSAVSYVWLTSWFKGEVAVARPCAHHPPRQQPRHPRVGSAVIGPRGFQCHGCHGCHGKGHGKVTWKKTRMGKCWVVLLKHHESLLINMFVFCSAVLKFTWFSKRQDMFSVCHLLAVTLHTKTSRNMNW